LIIRSENLLSPAQGRFAQGKIMLSTSSNDLIKK
jgi:hypothetical protein